MLLTHANIMTMDEGDFPDGYVLVRDGKIAALGNMPECPAAREGEPVFDLERKLLLPGFIDAHTHIGLVEDGIGLEGDDINEDTDPSTPHIRAIDGINPFDRGFAEARESGITTAVVSPGSSNPVAGQICALKTYGRWVDKMALSPVLAVKFSMGENPKASYSIKTQAPATRMGCAAIIREQLGKARRYWMDCQKAEQDEDMDAPEFDAKSEALIPLLKKEARAHFHAHRAYDILTAVRIAGEFDLDYTIVHCTEGYLIADILAELRIPAICGPLICARTKPELSNLSQQNVAALVQAGVTAAVSTDHPEIPVGFLASCASVAEANGLTRREALACITISAAKAAGIDDRVGSITVGKDADLLVFGTDPFTICAKPEMILIDGKLWK